MMNEIPAEAGVRDEAAVLRQVAEWEGALYPWMRAAIFRAAERLEEGGDECGMRREEHPPAPPSKGELGGHSTSSSKGELDGSYRNISGMPVYFAPDSSVDTDLHGPTRTDMDGEHGRDAQGTSNHGQDGRGTSDREADPRVLEAEITTSTGRRVRPFALRVEDVDLGEIAHALSHTCRFNGHTREFYSVAEHSVRVSWELEYLGNSRTINAAGLLHDAGEAYIHDVVRPIKAFFRVGGQPFQYWEDKILKSVFARFGLLGIWPLPPAVHEADRALCDAEMKELLTGERWRKPWSAEQARRLFLQRAEQVGVGE